MEDARDIWVGDREVRPSLGEIRLGMERIHVEPRSMEVLGALVRRAPEVVPKNELIAAVWGDAIVTDEVLTHAIWDLRRAFGDNANHPEFIQTIPKRGYRLIAPVKELDRQRVREPHGPQPGGEPAAPPARRRFRSWIWVLALITVLIVFAFRLGRNQVPGPSAVADSGARPQIPVALTLVPSEPFPGTEELVRRLERTLLNELAGLPGAVVRQGGSCQPVVGVTSLCLEAALLTGTEVYEVSAALRDASDGKILYSPPPSQPTGRSEVTAAAAEIAEQITTYFEVRRDPYFSDPDITPWVHLQHQDVRAVRDFLLGAKYVYRNETGGGESMAAAIARDPDFVAPPVWITPALVAGDDPAALASHRATLERLWKSGTAFEKAMINWAIARIDGSLPEQIRHLRVALEEEPGNAQAQFALGVALVEQQQFERAWQALAPLLESRWEFPGLYPLAADCALRSGRLDDAAKALELAIQTDPVDPEALGQLRLLAIYHGDTRKAARYGDWLRIRLEEMSPEVVALDLSHHAERLAARAEREGRPRIAERLLESAG